jgi:hypothetical protein
MNLQKKRRPLWLLLILAVIAAALLPATASAQTTTGPDIYRVAVTVTNLAPTNGTIQTPFWVAVHNGGFDTYNRGAAASPELERLAEDGNTGPLSEAFAANGRGQDATIAGPDGPLAPGDSATYTFIVKPKARRGRFFSYASMVIPSNDAFVANGIPKAHRLFTNNGRFIGRDFTIRGKRVLDAGTEVNDEIPENTAALAQAAPNTGVTEGGTVGAHAGFDPAGNILAARTGADFTSSGYDIARVEFDAEPIAVTTDTARLRGSNEVPALSTTVKGLAKVRLTLNGNLWFRFRTNETSGITGAHIHAGAPGENGPVLAVLYADPSGSQRKIDIRGNRRASDLMDSLEGGSISDLWALIEAGEAYVNVHTVANPAGEVRANLNAS